MDILSVPNPLEHLKLHAYILNAWCNGMNHHSLFMQELSLQPIQSIPLNEIVSASVSREL